MTGRDPVSNETAIRVVQRDGPCVAPRLSASNECWGRTTFDHIRDRPAVGDPIEKRGPRRKHRYRPLSDLEHLVAVCQGHSEDGRDSTGFQWNTANRESIRDYLASFGRVGS